MRQKNPLLIVLSVCGGCLLIGIVAVVVLGALGINKGKGFATGIMSMVQDMPTFLKDLKSTDYAGAASLMDPSVRQKFTAEKIQHMEEAVEKKLGRMQSYPKQFESQDQSTITDPTRPGQMPAMVYTYKYNVIYEKGSATATFKFKMPDPLHPSGLISDFSLEPNP